MAIGYICRPNNRLQRLQIKLINAFVIFVNVYYFNKRHMNCTTRSQAVARIANHIYIASKQTVSDC